VSNHARDGEESRHNLTYWRYRDYIGIGPGAHGRRLGHATVRHKKPENFLSGIARNAHGIESETALSPSDRATEALLMGLRLREGVDLGWIAAMSGLPIESLINPRAVDTLSSHKLVSRTEDQLIVSEAGMLVLDRILAEIVTA
jgi:coproporphyrinogen III oxidase-like Fe-S oxidoreductase